MAEIDLDDLVEELLQCRRCGICRNAVYEEMGFDGICPIWQNSGGFETDFMRGKIMVALALLDGRLQRTAENSESIFRCTLCGNCTQICGAEFNPVEAMEMVRQVLSDLPNDIRDTLAGRILETHTPYEEGMEVKRNWVSEVGFEVPPTGDVVYYVGCTAGAKLPSVAKAAAKILHAAGIKFAVMEHEPCCGSVMFRTGRVEDALENANIVVDRIKESGAKILVVTCAGCLKTLRKDYKEKYNLDLPEILHVVEYVQRLLGEGALEFKDVESPIRVTYHDPCHMGRELGIYDAPRYILEKIPGVELIEMDPNRDQTLCCGAGGGLRSYDSELAKEIAAERIDAANKLGVSMIVTACPFCEYNLVSGSKKAHLELDVVDIVELLAQTLE